MTSNYTFTHEFISGPSQPSFKVLYSTEAETAHGIVSDMYHFLLGCSFQQSSIIRALRDIADEMSVGEES